MRASECDDGDNTDSRGCKNDCSGPLPGWTCTGGDINTVRTCSVSCNDGVIISPEENCEDGNGISGDGCSNICKLEPGFDCTTVGNSTTCKGTCADGLLKPGEVCDDAILGVNKGCKADCSGPLPGWSCTGGDADNPMVCTEVCGDNIRTALE